MSESQLKCVRVPNVLFVRMLITKNHEDLCFSRLREENLKQRRLMEEIERVRNLVLNDAAVSKPHDSAPNKKKETATFKRIPISKNSYPSKVKFYSNNADHKV